MTLETDHALGALLSSPPPQISPARLAEGLAQHWQLQGHLSPLGGERDLNFRLQTTTDSYLVKLVHPAETALQTDLQCQALRHIARQAPALPVSQVIACPPDTTTDAGHAQSQPLWAELPEGRLRVLSWLEGQPMHLSARSPAQARATGAVLAQLAQALQGFVHPAADAALLWDIQQARGLQPLLPAIADPHLRALAQAQLQYFDAEVAPRLAALPRHFCHGDFNRHNLLVDATDTARIVGVIDFGDLLRAPRICDLAIAASYQLGDGQPLPLPQLTALVRGYDAQEPLAAAETALLYDLILVRLVASLAIGSWRAQQYPENAAYISRNLHAAAAGLSAMAGLGREAVTAALRAACACGADRRAQGMSTDQNTPLDQSALQPSDAPSAGKRNPK